MKTILSFFLMLFSLGAFANNSSEYLCKDLNNTYKLRIVYSTAYMRNTTEIFEDILAQEEYLLQKTADSYVFANLRANKLFICELIKAAPKMVHLTGSLVRVAGIGGESTGIALKLRNGAAVVEVIGAKPEITEKMFTMIGATVGVAGYFKIVRGVEIPRRKVLVVKNVAELMIRPVPRL